MCTDSAWLLGLCEALESRRDLLDSLSSLPALSTQLPAMLAPDTTLAGTTAADRVLQLPELLQTVLEKLDMKTLLLAQRVNKVSYLHVRAVGDTKVKY